MTVVLLLYQTVSDLIQIVGYGNDEHHTRHFHAPQQIRGTLLASPACAVFERLTLNWRSYGIHPSVVHYPVSPVRVRVGIRHA